MAMLEVRDLRVQFRTDDGLVKAVEGNKLTVAFDKAGEKKVIDSFVERA